MKGYVETGVMLRPQGVLCANEDTFGFGFVAPEGCELPSKLPCAKSTRYIRTMFQHKEIRVDPKKLFNLIALTINVLLVVSTVGCRLEVNGMCHAQSVIAEVYDAVFNSTHSE